MIFSDKEIRARISGDKETSLITPFCEEQLQGASYDLSLGESVTVLKNIGKVIEPQEDQLLNDAYVRVDLGPDGYVLSPGGFVLAKIQEYVVIPENCVAHIRPRTRFTRSGVLIADQHCNPTYKGVLHIGLFNMGANPIRLTKGLRIAQILFEELSSMPSVDKLYENKTNAAYEGEKEFRGSQFGETGWSKETEDAYNIIMQKLTGASHDE